VGGGPAYSEASPAPPSSLPDAPRQYFSSDPSERVVTVRPYQRAGAQRVRCLNVSTGDLPGTDDDRTVDLAEDDGHLMPDQTTDDTDLGWGERGESNDDRLLDERPPHWD
jgi:hypothetical protein